MDICPNCGDAVSFLDERTGWCLNCSPRKCARCGKDVEPRRKHCNSCTRIIWLEEHADEIEEEQSRGLSLSAARTAIYEKNRPRCLVCEQTIEYAKRDALLCNRTAKCRSARRRYRTLTQGAQHLPKQIAMEQVLRELDKL